MRLADLQGKKVAILGFGKEGQATLQAIRSHGIDCAVTILDGNQALSVPGETVIAGGEYLSHLAEFDVVIKSPGIPPSSALASIEAKLTTPTRLFFGSVHGTGARIVGITGSKGKSTTTSLIHAILTAAGRDSVLVGNIGIPSIGQIDRAKAGTIFVLEMSSYQLLDLDQSPPIAVVTSFFPEHLDYHGSLEAYKQAKGNIARFQKEDDMVFYNADSPGAKELASAGHGKKIPYSADGAPLPIEDTKLIGRHNQSNMAGAWAVAEHLGVPKDIAVQACKQFEGLPHRLQRLGTHAGIEWVDDAISTTPESAMAALDALGDRVATIILGGQDRGYDFRVLAQRIKNSSVATVILFPGSGPRIRETIGDAHADVCFQEADSMEKAVSLAKKHTMAGKICLLSTASPSYGMFKNFEEKGDRFQEEIKRGN